MTEVERNELVAALSQDAAALGLAPTACQVDTLIGYIELLHRWNSVYNLTAVRQPRDMLTQHVVDCLTTIHPLERVTSGVRCSLLDVGSGGGLPGLVIAAMSAKADVTCVDAVGKKAAFVQQAAGELGLKNLRSMHARAEHMAPGAYDVIACRAFASLNTLVRTTEPLLKPGGRWMAMKGTVPTQEISELPAHIEVFHVEQVTVPRLAARRCLVWMRPNVRTQGPPTL